MRLILYGHEKCHLCDRLEGMIRPYLLSRHLELSKCDVGKDPRWWQTYRMRIPVLTLDDQVILEGRPDETEVAAAFEKVASSE